MTTGTLQSIVVCVDSSTPTPAFSPCPSGQVTQVMSAYVLDPSSANLLQALNTPFDYTVAGAFWVSSFVFTLTLYFFSRFIGQIIAMVRRDFG